MTVLRTDRRRLAVGALLLACFLGCSGRWERADEFQERLRCGQSPAEVSTLAEDFGVESFRPVSEANQYTTHVMNQESTFFEFFFDDSGLKTVRQGASVGPTTGTSYEPRVNLCTGEVTDDLSLTVKGLAELAGATVLVDGEPYGHLSRGPGYETNIRISTGSHQIRIEKEGYEPVIVPVEYGPGTRAAKIDLSTPTQSH